ncbi:MAG: ATP-binding protein [candidate division NC10 bacterium]|nr:ATP-binding protein [candidate division NC10 bacterium]
MATKEYPIAETEGMVRRIRWLMGMRLAVVILFLGSATFIQLKEEPPFSLAPLYFLIFLTFFFSLIFSLLLNRVRQLELFCYAQIACDLLLETGLVHYTGGLESGFSFIYIFSIIAAASLLSRRGAFLVASASSILYGGLINLEFYGILPRIPLFGSRWSHQPGYAVFLVFVNIAAYFLVALLSSHLAERLRETGRKLEERSADLYDLQSLYRDVVANISSGLVTMNRKGQILSFNQAAEEITGYSAQELIGKSWKESPFSASQQMSAFFETEAPFASGISSEVQIRRKDGARVPIGISLSQLRDGRGETVGLIAIFRDLTEIKKMEAQLRRADRLAAVGQLAAGIAHEVRNPLGAISSSLQLLKEESSLSGGERKLLDIVLREAERLKLISGQLLDFVRPRFPAPGTVELNSLLGEMSSLLARGSDQDPPRRIVIEKSPSPVYLQADPDQIKQVIWNLSLNALEAMPEGGELKIRLSQAQGEDGSLLVEFQDQGHGIPPEQLEHIFDPFFTTKEGGTGLGLAIAQKIILSLGGRIEVESGKEQGTVFRVFLNAGSGPGKDSGAEDGTYPGRG